MNERSDETESKEQLSLEKELEMDRETPDSLYQGEIRSLQRESEIQHLSGRMTFLFILIPTLICAVFAFAYIDLRGRLKSMESSGAKEVKALSEDVVGKVTSVLEQYKALGARLSAIEKSVENANAVLKKEQKVIKKLGASKLDKKEGQMATKKVADDMNLKFAELKEALTLQNASTESLANKLEKELDEGANAVATFQSDLRMQTEKVTKLSETLERAQKKALELDLGVRRLFDDREAWNKELDSEKRATRTLQQKIVALEDEITWIENRLKLKREKKEAPKDSEANVQKKTPQPSPSATQGTGQIVEQDISQ